MPIAPILHRPGGRAKPALHHLRRCDVVLASAERRPNARQEVEQVRGDEACGLAERSLRAVDDEGHECERVGQVFRVEGHDEKGHLPSGVFLGVGVGVREGQGGEEGVAVEEDTCKCLVQSPSVSLLSM